MLFFEQAPYKKCIEKAGARGGMMTAKNIVTEQGAGLREDSLEKRLQELVNDYITQKQPVLMQMKK